MLKCARGLVEDRVGLAIIAEPDVDVGCVRKQHLAAANRGIRAEIRIDDRFIADRITALGCGALQIRKI
jgi:hypothetical protein